jgi:hypothetical protein
MARIRTVKPELFRHEELFEAEIDTGLPLRLSFIALFTACDREGRFKWRPRQLKLDCLPYDEIDFSRVLDALLTCGFIVQYEVDGVIYGCIPSFTTHQIINNRESESIFPPPPSFNSIPAEVSDVKPAEPGESSSETIDMSGDGNPDNHASLTREERVDHAAQGEREKEGKGKGRERESNTRVTREKKNKTSWPVNFSISDSVRDWYLKQGYQESIQDHFESFKNKCLAKGYQYADWDAAFRNAIADDWAGARKQKSQPPAANRGAGFHKQPMQRPDYSKPVRNGDAIDSTCTVDYT